MRGIAGFLLLVWVLQSLALTRSYSLAPPERYGCHSVITFSYHVASSMPLAASTGGACATSSSVNSSGVSQQELPYRSMIRRSGVEAGRANKARRLEPFAGSFLEAAGA